MRRRNRGRPISSKNTAPGDARAVVGGQRSALADTVLGRRVVATLFKALLTGSLSETVDAANVSCRDSTPGTCGILAASTDRAAVGSPHGL
jgi:hypothetical protein